MLGLVPEVQTGNHVLARFVFVSVDDLRRVQLVFVRPEAVKAYLSSGRMQHPDVLPSNDVNQFAGLNVPNFDKVGLKRQDIWVRQRERIRSAFPRDFPIRTCPPPIAVDEEGEVAVVEKELSVHTLNVDGLDVFFPCDEIE